MRRAPLQISPAVAASSFIMETALVPHAAGKHDPKRGSLTPALICSGYVNLSGGFNKQLSAAACLHIQIGATNYIFLELYKNAGWFLKGVGGPQTRKSNIKPLHVLTELRDRFAIACGEVTVVADTAVADAAVADAIVDDTMNALDDVALPQPNVKAKPKTKKGLHQSVVHDVVMPTRPACVENGEDDTTTVIVYRKSVDSFKVASWLTKDGPLFKGGLH